MPKWHHFIAVFWCSFFHPKEKSETLTQGILTANTLCLSKVKSHSSKKKKQKTNNQNLGTFIVRSSTFSWRENPPLFAAFLSPPSLSVFLHSTWILDQILPEEMYNISVVLVCSNSVFFFLIKTVNWFYNIAFYWFLEQHGAVVKPATTF